MNPAPNPNNKLLMATTLILTAGLVILFALAWHDQPAPRR